MDELDFDPQTYADAISENPQLLIQLFRHPSSFIRARVAGNEHTPEAVRNTMGTDSSPGVVVWLLGNPSLTKIEFDIIFDLYINGTHQGVEMVLSALAGSRLADLSQLTKLLGQDRWGVTMSVLDNHRDRRGKSRGDKYKALIKSKLHPEHASADRDPSKWDEMQKLAYLRTFGVRCYR